MIIKSQKANNNDNQDTKLLNKIILDQIDNINDNVNTLSERSEEQLNEKINNFCRREDLRPTIWCLFSKTGFETHKVDDEQRQRLLTCMH